MHILIENKNLISAVHTAARFAERRSATLPALASILILASDEGVKMRSTNLEAGIDLKVPASVKAPGAVAVPATLLQQVASSLSPEGSTTLEQAGDVLTMTVGGSKLSLKTTPYEDFPSIPFPENPTHRLILPAATLRGVLAAIASCASTSTIRPELASILFSMARDSVTLVATDSFRLAEKKIPVSVSTTSGAFLIPAKNALEIAQALPEEDIIISFDEHQCAFITNTLILVSRLTNATYPDYRQIIPKESVVEATVLRKDFETALKRTSIFADAFQKVRLSFDPKKKELVLSARNQDLGESTETVSAQLSGEAAQMSFNYRYLAAIFALTGAESLTFSVAGVGRPLIIRGAGDASLLYLVSPMNQ
ncbi:MAG: DNA polymerase III subunit beta [Patescibacteria group bacterium]|nr:DNA polymerase III subunit beta [Patescibacteria group bacterium]MDE1944060.1 DNA polymerase III subunit beta [Patescibacteria group bacterium]MDE1944721.1 DNA polymerase III subunit beta [Patescibacteria group bacterium]MDE2057265.1 DNA polymerase III subunit beta [Patescibacteria group bacterium]